MIDFYDEVLKHKDDILNDIHTLCKIPSVYDASTAKENQPFGEACRVALDQMLAFGKRDGFECVDVDGYAGHIDIGEADETFGILGHLDVVPCNDTGWNTPAYDMTVIGEKIFGRGVADDKGPLIAAYYAAKIVNTLDFEKKMKMRVIFGCNEENGSNCMKYYFTKKPFPAMGFTPDAEFPVVHGEKAISHFMLNGQFPEDNIIGIYAGTRPNIVPGLCEAYVVGSYKTLKDSFNAFLNDHHLEGSIEEEGNHTKLTLIGKSAHASTPNDGLNAAAYLCHYLRTITTNPFVEFIDHYFYKDNAGKNLGIAFVGEMKDLTVNLGIVKYKNQSGHLTIDLRVPHEVTEESLVEKMTAVTKDYGFSVDHDFEGALYMDPHSELITKLHNSYVEYTGDHEHQPQCIGGGTYAKTMPNCVGFGAEFPGRNNQMHQNNEVIYIDDLMKSAAIYAKALYDIIKK